MLLLVHVVMLAGLTACAGSIAPPTAVSELTRDQRDNLHIATVTTEASPGVTMTPEALTRLKQRVISEIQALSPAVLNAEAPQAKSMKVTITRYDEGNAFARFMLIGLGQIYIEGDVALIDPLNQQTLAMYKVSKNFSFGGVYGGVTTVLDVEQGFARSVAEVVKPNT